MHGMLVYSVDRSFGGFRCSGDRLIVNHSKFWNVETPVL